MDVKIEESWKAVLREEFDKEYFSRIAAFLHQEKREGKTIYPPGPLIFNAFRLTPFEQVKVVILGQDPYHGPGQAHGLSFSVQDGVALPPSLQNIYKEISNDIGTTLSDKKDGLVFMLWGNYARSKRLLIDSSRHLVLEAAHPSPLARGAFFGCRHFSKANEYLISQGKTPIVW